jgi:hypothetical protein
MNYVETVGTLKGFLGSSEAVYVFGSRVDQFSAIVSMIETHVSESNKMDNGSVVAAVDQITNVQAAIEYIKAVLLELPITKGITDFGFAFCNLVGNWLSNCAPGEKRLFNEVAFVERFIKYDLTSKETLSILPTMIQKIRSIGQIGFPSVQLAKHYLSVLDEENKKEAKNAIRMGGDACSRSDDSKG